MSLDYSFANSGICISKIIDDKITVLYSDVFLSDKKLDTIPRISGLIDKILGLHDEYKPDIIVRESPFIGRSSTAKNVLYAHALLESELYNRQLEIEDRKSTRLNSSHVSISYAVFCLKKKKKTKKIIQYHAS